MEKSKKSINVEGAFLICGGWNFSKSVSVNPTFIYERDESTYVSIRAKESCYHKLPCSKQKEVSFSPFTFYHFCVVSALWFTSENKLSKKYQHTFEVYIFFHTIF